ncbi:hypothetical protein BDZ89DRAFT_1055759 [Hymenopellis radicata]|nr:hypothetical protein BDZ89DRAFT_1055759 [Hymenopellis radicata]
MLASVNFHIPRLHIRSLESHSNKCTPEAGERRPIQRRKASLNLRTQYHNSSRDVARTEPEVTINDAYVVVL